MNMDNSAALTAIARLVLKQGVSLGLLDEATRQWALALAWRCLPQDPPQDLSPGPALTEAQVNAVLRSFVDQGGAFLRTDHVELRRWLVDDGWLSRDGFGREYRASSVEALRAPQRDAARPLAGIDVNAWVHGLREQAQAEARRRRQAWEAGRAVPAQGQAAGREP